MYNVWVRFKYGPSGAQTAVDTRCQGNTESALMTHLLKSYAGPIILLEVRWH